ncbi:MAG: GNAT family N-acetyltransferase [Flavobacteriales bacterium]
MDVRIINPSQTYDLRWRVLWPHKNVLNECFIDIDNEPGAFHLAVFDDKRIVSIGSFFRADSPKLEGENLYRLRAMATDPEYRGKGCGKLLLENAFDILKEKKCTSLWCDARVVAFGFYRSLGFKYLEEAYMIPIIGEHYFMWKPL